MKSAAESILDLARWAPSGDNTQPWRFALRSEREIDVHGYDTRDTCVYDLDGWASEIAHGALLETLALAATRFGMRAELRGIERVSERHSIYRVRLEPAPGIAEDALVGQILERAVQRGPMRAVPLSSSQREALERAAHPCEVVWFASARDRARVAQLSFRSAHIRLTTPEAYAVHSAVIAWNARTSEDRLPDAALGADPVLLATMRWALASWRRVRLLNRFAAGTWMPRLALDVVPALACSAHFALIAAAEPRSQPQRIEAGRAVQRFWLEAARCGLQLQPNYTPLVFARYARERRAFTTVPAARRRAEEIAQRLDRLLAPLDSGRAVFLGRVGPARPVAGRSLRLPLASLVVEHAPESLPPPSPQPVVSTSSSS